VEQSDVLNRIQTGRSKPKGEQADMRSMAVLTLVFVGLLLLSGSQVAVAETSAKPIQIALWNPAQVFPEDTSIHGLRLNLLYGVNRDMYGIDLGLVNHTTGTVKGYQYGLVGLADGDFYGWQNNFVSITAAEFYGFQSGLYNQVGTGIGFQYGFINISESFEGFQLGLVNMTETLHGLQIGLLNIMSKEDAHPILPIVNWSF
jgi:hypothetical protein